jgi:hypothetical protein
MAQSVREESMSDAEKDFYGRPLLTKEEIKEIRDTKNLPPVKIETMLMKAGFQ